MLNIRQVKIVQCFFYCYLLNFTVYSQNSNLVLNSSFESYISCPTAPYIQIYCSDWKSLTFTSVDYYNACDNTIGWGFGVPHNYTGSQNAKTGVAYAGIVLYASVSEEYRNYREYLQGFLKEPLTMGKKYCVEFYVSLSGEKSRESFDLNVYTTENIGVFLAKDTSPTYLGIPNYWYQKNLNVFPQITNVNGVLDDSLNWTLISGKFISEGDEKYIFIGNFLPDSLTTAYGTDLGIAYYYIDDVSVYLCEDTLSPTDTFYLHIPNVFTPNADGLNDTWQVKAKGVQQLRAAVYNRWGSLLWQQEVFADSTQNELNLSWDGRSNTGMPASAGTYYYLVTCTNKEGEIKKEKGFLTLTN